MAQSNKAEQMASNTVGAAAVSAATTTLPSCPATTTPYSAKAVLQKQGEHAMDRDDVKASIQYARHNGGWVAEFRFALRAGLCWACTLPLTTSSEHFATEAAALGHAARRMLDSLSAVIDGDALTKAQQKSVDALVAWATGFLVEASPANATAEPLAGKRFLDLFAGIGGFHIALASQVAVCAGAVELDVEARKVYRANHAGAYPMHDDIRTASTQMFGHVDIVRGGFPCQSFSVAGAREGLDNPDKGALFFELARLIGELKPSMAILENVAGLRDHDGGKTFDTVMDALTGLGYSVSTKLLNAGDFGLPQMRERLFLVCIHDSVLTTRVAPFIFPKGTDATKVVADILEPTSGVAPCKRDMARLKPNPKARSTRIERVGLIDGMDHQGYRVASAQGKGFTLCANSGGLGGKSGLYLVNRTIRKLNARECARMQGFPESFTPHANESAALRQFGNSVAIPKAIAIARSLGIKAFAQKRIESQQHKAATGESLIFAERMRE